MEDLLGTVLHQYAPPACAVNSELTGWQPRSSSTRDRSHGIGDAIRCLGATRPLRIGRNSSTEGAHRVKGGEQATVGLLADREEGDTVLKMIPTFKGIQCMFHCMLDGNIEDMKPSERIDKVRSV